MLETWSQIYNKDLKLIKINKKGKKISICIKFCLSNNNLKSYSYFFFVLFSYCTLVKHSQKYDGECKTNIN